MTLTPVRPETAADVLSAALNGPLQDNEAFARHQERNLRPDVVRELGRRIEEAGVEYIYYALPTIGSRMVAKMVPANHFRRNLQKGIAFHRTALSDLQNDRYGNLIGGG
ncbi:glutamine synthetase, partial [Arthrobacter deserti]|nr:glutamine synthetase [Arthrobacter deserti]